MSSGSRQSGRGCAICVWGGQGCVIGWVKVWPPSRGRLADLLITADTHLGSWWCRSRFQGNLGCCCHICRGPWRSLQSSFDANKSELFLSDCRSSAAQLLLIQIRMCIRQRCVSKGAIFKTFTLRTLIFIYMQPPVSGCLVGLWFICSA